MGIMTAVAVGSLAYGIYQGNRQMKMQQDQIEQAGIAYNKIAVIDGSGKVDISFGDIVSIPL